MKINIVDVIRDINMRDLLVFESALAHEKKNIGVKAFCKRYEENINEFKKTLNHVEFCFLISYLEYLDNNFHYDNEMKLDGYLLDIEDMQALEWGFENEIDFDNIYDLALPFFKERGFLIQELSEAVGYGTSN